MEIKLGIFKLLLITNGSVVPNKKELQIIKKYGIRVRLSDYTHKITYAPGIYREWMDLGFPDKVPCIGQSREDTKHHMMNCSLGCHIIIKRKFFIVG